jgi:hypothetical protein
MRDAIAVTLLLTSAGCAHMTDPCKNTLLERLPSPDGTLVLSTYHRECRTETLTTAHVEKPAQPPSGSGELVCSLISWGDKYPVKAAWQSKEAIAISTTERVEKSDVRDSKESCGSIKVSYSIQFRNEQQRTDDEAVLARMREMLAEIGPCIDAAYGSTNDPDSPTRQMQKLIERQEHRSMVGNLFGYLDFAACPLSAETYARLSELSSAFDLKPGYLQSAAPLVKR